VDFPTAVKTVFLQKYADFSGRSRRSEFWFGYLGYFIVAVVVGVLDALLGTKILAYVLFLAAVVPIWASGARRLHDTGRSGWWLLICFTGIGIIVLIVWFVEEGKPEVNQYGPSPKGDSGYNPNGGYGQAPGYGQNQDPTWGQPPA
jgi:uncharacterized membrane protein YhaH (DUF805 family)